MNDLKKTLTIPLTKRTKYLVTKGLKTCTQKTIKYCLKKLKKTQINFNPMFMDLKT